jgi:carboxypeptidase C (cathepsin A)
MIGELIMRLFHARTNAHVLHLQTRSYAQHAALREFYEALVDMTDSLAEVYQGQNGLIDDYPSTYKHIDDAGKLVSQLAEWVENNRYDAIAPEQTHIHNIVDEIVSLCRTTTYKLKFLK